ncbi:hypothetical protein KSP40_PGU001092 [Platanthera guangdongensis]|uniref:Ribosomal protein L19 n=1 Tax=Platanthera guangdongensis TaxID=2320717 RepID=A0ABR2MYC2_9ASPA
MHMFWSNIRVKNLANYEVTCSTLKVIFPVSNIVSTMKPNIWTRERGTIFQRNYLATYLTKTHFSEIKLSQRELLLYKYTVSHAGIYNEFPSIRCMATLVPPVPHSHVEQPCRIKFKRLDKTAKHIMNILDKEAVEEVRTERDIPDIKPGCIVQMKVEVPENRRRTSILKGIVIARRNAGLNTTFRLRRLVAGVGVESVFPLYSPNIKEMKILDRKKVRRAKLYYLRDRMNPLKK